MNIQLTLHAVTAALSSFPHGATEFKSAKLHNLLEKAKPNQSPSCDVACQCRLREAAAVESISSNTINLSLSEILASKCWPPALGTERLGTEHESLLASEIIASARDNCRQRPRTNIRMWQPSQILNHTQQHLLNVKVLRWRNPVPKCYAF